MATLFRPSRLLRSLLALSSAHSINFSTTAKSRHNYLNLPKRKSSDDIAWGSAGKDARYLNKLRRLLSKADDEDRKLILYMAQKVANR